MHYRARWKYVVLVHCCASKAPDITHGSVDTRPAVVKTFIYLSVFFHAHGNLIWYFVNESILKCKTSILYHPGKYTAMIISSYVVFMHVCVVYLAFLSFLVLQKNIICISTHGKNLSTYKIMSMCMSHVLMQPQKITFRPETARALLDMKRNRPPLTKWDFDQKEKQRWFFFSFFFSSANKMLKNVQFSCFNKPL